MQRTSLMWAAGALLASAIAVQAAPPPYYITNISVAEIGTLGGNESVAMDVNDQGDIVGWSLNGSGSKHAFSYHNGTGLMEDISPGSTVVGEAHGINNKGQIVGSVWELFTVAHHAFYYNGVQSMFMLDDSTYNDCRPGSDAAAINDDGFITGDVHKYCDDWSITHSVRWTYNGYWLLLLNYHQGGTRAHNINAAGVIVGDDHTGSVTDSGGWYWDPTSVPYTNGLMIPKGTPPEIYLGYDAEAFGINGSGQIVGEMPMTPDPNFPVPNFESFQRAILWPYLQLAQIFPIFSDGKNAGAREINDLDFTVGWADRSTPLAGLQKRAAIWTPDKAITMLPLPPGITDGTLRSPTVCEALAVSNRVGLGLIHAVGYCEIDGKRKAVLWNITVSQIMAAPPP